MTPLFQGDNHSTYIEGTQFIIEYRHSIPLFRKWDTFLVPPEVLEASKPYNCTHLTLRCLPQGIIAATIPLDIIIQYPARKMLFPPKGNEHLYCHVPTREFEIKSTASIGSTNKENKMALIPMDFSEERVPVGPGVYPARIVAAENKTSKAGNPYINWQLELFGEPKIVGTRIYHMTMTTGPMAGKTAELHEAATGEKIDRKAKQYDPEMLVNREITVTAVADTYTNSSGETKNKLVVKAVAPYKQ